MYSCLNTGVMRSRSPLIMHWNVSAKTHLLHLFSWFSLISFDQPWMWVMLLGFKTCSLRLFIFAPSLLQNSAVLQLVWNLQLQRIALPLLPLLLFSQVGAWSVELYFLEVWQSRSTHLDNRGCMWLNAVCFANWCRMEIQHWWWLSVGVILRLWRSSWTKVPMLTHETRYIIPILVMQNLFREVQGHVWLVGTFSQWWIVAHVCESQTNWRYF